MPQQARPRRPPSCAECEYRTLRMFCNLSADALKEFDEIGVQLTVSKGSIIFYEGDAATSVTVICTGQVKLSCSSAEGRTMILKIAMSGDVLGLSSVVSGTVYEVTAEALETCMVKTIPKASFLRFLDRHGIASMHAAKALADDYRSAYFDARRLALSTSVQARLASLLLDWGRGANCGKHEMRFTMSLTHEDLANLAGTTRESISRSLARLQKDKLIEIRGSSILIPDPDKLEEMSQ
jgi:CRP/FNR family transcriptional regulator, cyclic AMP receptor protein